MGKREFYVVVTKDENGCLIGEAPQLASCINQGETLDELMKNMRKTIEYCLEVENEVRHSSVVGVYSVKREFEIGIKNPQYYVLVKDDCEGGYIGIAPELKGCLSHGLTLEELMSNMEEVISLCLDDGEEALNSSFFGVQRLTV